MHSACSARHYWNTSCYFAGPADGPHCWVGPSLSPITSLGGGALGSGNVKKYDISVNSLIFWFYSTFHYVGPDEAT